jgi:hypothetical protein
MCLNISQLEKQTHHVGTPLKEWSARHNGSYIYNTHETQEKNIHALRGIQTCNPSNQVAAVLST